jgi:HlyD family secretion protein
LLFIEVKTMRRVILGIAAVIILGSGIYWFTQQQSAEATEFEILRQSTVERNRITATVNATGSIEPETSVSLTFGTAGTIQQVEVVRGQTVTAGTVLATLNAAEVQLAVQQAEDALRIQELTLQQRLNSEPTTATLASAQADIDAAQAQLSVAQANLAQAEAGVLQAQAQLAQLNAGPRPGDVAAAEANVANARLQQQNAQIAYNQTLECFTRPDTGEEVCPGLGAPEEQARAQLEQANTALQVAETQLADAQAGPRPSDIQAANAAVASAQAGVLAAEGNVQAAEANVARAEAAYARLLEGPTADEIAILEAQVASARTNLALAQLRLDQSKIVAPTNGRIANILIRAGEQAAPGTPAMVLVNEAAFRLEVNVDEIDIDQISVGQSVQVTLDALPDRMITGEVADVAPTPVSTAGVVTYQVTVNLEETAGVDLRSGMSANASIVVDEIDDVLIVPNWAVRLDRETGNAYVNVLAADGRVSEVTIATGLRNEQFSEVLSGLNSGDVVVVTSERSTFSFFGG